MKKTQMIYILVIMVSLLACYVFLPFTHVIAEDDGNNSETNETDDNPSQELSDSNEKENESDQDTSRQETDYDDIDEEQEAYEKRDIVLQVNTTDVLINSTWKRDNLADWFKVHFQLNESPQIIIEYNANSNKSGTELMYVVILEKIKEYIDTNHNGRYNKNDTILSNYSFDSKKFTNITHSLEKSAKNETIHIFSTGTVDGVFSIVLHVVGNFTKIDSEILAPSEVKIDFIIHYPYTSNSSLIALRGKIRSEYATESDLKSFDNTGDDRNESDIKIISGNHSGFLSWNNQVLVDGVSRLLNVTVIQIEGSQSANRDTIYFCYPRGESIIHDPKIGVVSLSSLSFIPSQPNPLSPANILLYLGVFVIVSLIFIGTIYLRKRM